MLASAIVRMAWYQAMPSATRPDASKYVGMLWAIPIQSAM